MINRRAAVFLDRDGVLAEAIVRDGRAYAPTRIEDFVLVPEAAGQVERLRKAGLLRIVFTNQPDLARGTLTPHVLDTMHRTLRSAMLLDDVLVCPHEPDSGCGCHKPEPGMLHQAVERWSVSLSDSFVIGDRWRDIDAGRAAGCFSILLERPYSQCGAADARVDDLRGAVDLILERLGT